MDSFDLCYAIQTHKNPHQLKRLIDRLSEENSYFYIHIDLKVDIQCFKEILGGGRQDNIIFLEERRDVIWGDFSQVMTTISLMENIIKNHKNGFYIPLTGQCYPIKSKEHIRNFLSNNKHQNFVDALLPIENIWNERICFDRTKRFLFHHSSKRKNYFFLDTITNIRLLRINLIALLKKKINCSQFIDTFFERKIDLKLYGGNSMFTLNLDTLKLIYNYIQTHKKKLFSYFKYTSAADEIFFHTIIMDLIKQNPSIKFQNYDTVFIDWNEWDCSDKMCFRENHFEKLINLPGYELTARKFAPKIDKEILDLLDKYIDNKK